MCVCACACVCTVYLASDNKVVGVVLYRGRGPEQSDGCLCEVPGLKLGHSGHLWTDRQTDRKKYIGRDSKRQTDRWTDRQEQM